MTKNTNIIGFALLLIPAFLGSLWNSIAYHNWINSIPGFQSTIKELIILSFVLFIVAIIFFIPILIGMIFIKRRTDQKTRQLLLLNSGTLVYAILLTSALGYFTSDLKEAFYIIVPYFLPCLLVINYFASIKRAD